MTADIRPDTLTKWAIRPWVQLALRTNFVQLLLFHLFVQYSHFVSAIAFVSHHICFRWNLAWVITLTAEWIYAYGINHWSIFWISYKKLAQAWFERTVTEFCADALTDRALKPWVQLILTGSFVQLLLFYLFNQSSHFTSTIAFISPRPHLLWVKCHTGNHVNRRMNQYIWYSPLKGF